MISEDIYEAMAEVTNTKRGTDYIGSYWFELLYTVLQTNHPELAEKTLEHASDITKIGMRGLFRIPSVDITPRSLLDQRERNGSRGGTRSSSVSHGKYRVGKLHAEKGVRQGVRNASIRSITPTLLATIWDDLDEVERSNITQIVVDYLETKRSEIIDAEQ